MDYVPEQELFDELYEICQQACSRTFDYLPMNEVEYPFIQLGNTQQVDIGYKNTRGAILTQTINVWGTLKMRFRVTSMMEEINQMASGTLYTDHFRFVSRASRTDKQIMNDTSVPDTVLVHGIMTLVFNLT